MRIQTVNVIGRKYEEVVTELKAQGQLFRIQVQDGNIYGGTCDVQPTRMNFGVNNGIITSVTFG